MDVFLPKPANTEVLSALFARKLRGLGAGDLCRELHAEFPECRVAKLLPSTAASPRGDQGPSS